MASHAPTARLPLPLLDRRGEELGELSDATDEMQNNAMNFADVCLS